MCPVPSRQSFGRQQDMVQHIKSGVIRPADAAPPVLAALQALCRPKVLSANRVPVHLCSIAASKAAATPYVSAYSLLAHSPDDQFSQKKPARAASPDGDPDMPSRKSLHHDQPSDLSRPSRSVDRRYRSNPNPEPVRPHQASGSFALGSLKHIQAEPAYANLTSNPHPHHRCAVLSFSQAGYSIPARGFRCRARQTTPASRPQGCWSP
jgi:hypothetical protein